MEAEPVRTTSAADISAQRVKKAERLLPGLQERREKDQKMRFEGDPQVLINLFKKKQLLEIGDPRQVEIRPVLLIDGGSMKGVYGGGQVTALEKFRLTNVFDVVVGISTGAPTAAYFIAGQAALGTRIYSEECTTSRFISIGRALLKKVIMRTDYLAQIFRGEESNKKLNQEAIKESRTELYVVATDAKTGEGVFLDAKSALPDSVQAIQASLALPGISEGSVEVNGKPYLDGTASPLSAKETIERFSPTDLVVFMNRAEFEESGKLSERFLWPLFLGKFPSHVKKQYARKRREDKMKKELDFLRSQTKCRVIILWSDGKIESLTQDKKKLVAAAKRSEEHLSSLLTIAEEEAR